MRRGVQPDWEEEAHCIFGISDYATNGLHGMIRYPMYMGMRVALTNKCHDFEYAQTRTLPAYFLILYAHACLAIFEITHAVQYNTLGSGEPWGP